MDSGGVVFWGGTTPKNHTYTHPERAEQLHIFVSIPNTMERRAILPRQMDDCGPGTAIHDPLIWEVAGLPEAAGPGLSGPSQRRWR